MKECYIVFNGHVNHDPDQYCSKLANVVCNYDVSLRGQSGQERHAEQHFALFSTNYGTLS